MTAHTNRRPRSRKPRPAPSLATALRSRLRVESLETRTLLSVTVVAPFESDLSSYKTALHVIPNADVTEAAAHDGLQGLDKHDGYEWLIGTDPASQVHQGETISAWVQFHSAADGRAYLGFGAAPAAPNANSGSGRTLSLVLAPNTNQLFFENHNRLDNFTPLGSPVSQTYDPDTWYRVEVAWGTDGSLMGRLYDSGGIKLLNTVTATNTAITQGNVAFRAFGNDKYVDTVVVDSDSTATPQEIVDAGGGLDPNWVPTDPPPPLTNGPSDGETPIPWDYTSLPGTGKDIELQSFNDLQQVLESGGYHFYDDGTGTFWVAMGAQNISHNVGTVGVDWGPSFGGPATPMLGQYIFRQRPGEATELLGVPADVKHFFAPDVLTPGNTDAYGSGLNWVQSLMTPGSELDPVTGRLQRPSYIGHQNNDGVDVQDSRTYGPLDHRLRVPVADLDPDQNPAGTRWFLMGNIFVEGDQNVDNNSRWVEFTPQLDAANQHFTFLYPNGAGGQLNFRTMPGLVENGVGARITGTTPNGNVFAPVSVVQVTFNKPVDASTFTPDQVVFTAPDGSIIPVANVTPSDNTNRHFDVAFDAQTGVGAYTMVIGPNILDLDGNPMPQAYTAHFSIHGPSITDSTPNGNVLDAVGRVTVTFDEPIDAATFTTDQVAFTAPDGSSITINDVSPSLFSNRIFFIDFDPQGLAGTYVMVIGPNILDRSGNPMAAPYTARFTVQGPSVAGYTPSGGVITPVSRVTVTFNKPINPDTFTVDQIVSFAGPNGAIDVDSVAPADGSNNTRFNIDFAEQSDFGVYTLVISPDVQDTFGNPLAAAFTAHFTIIDPSSIGSDNFGHIASVGSYEDLEILGQPGTFVIIDHADDESDAVNLGSNTFTFYGTTYTGNNRLYVSSNGLISFGQADSAYQNSDLSTTPSEPVIAPLWNDWIKQPGDPTGAMLLGQFDGNRLILEWNQIQHFGAGAGRHTFVAVLTLNTGTSDGDIALNFNDLRSGDQYAEGAGSTVGIKTAGTANPDRLVINSSGHSSQFVGTRQAILITSASGAPGTRTGTHSAHDATLAAAVRPSSAAVFDTDMTAASAQFKEDRHVAGLDQFFAEPATKPEPAPRTSHPLGRSTPTDRIDLANGLTDNLLS